MLVQKHSFQRVRASRFSKSFIGMMALGMMLLSSSCEQDPVDAYRDRFRTIDMTIYPSSPVQLKITDDMSPFYLDRDSPVGFSSDRSGSFGNSYSSGFGNLRSR